jgi:NAD(P)-dependent dehydrogenase (short-subunit alcohol dehydrogenase family)
MGKKLKTAAVLAIGGVMAARYIAQQNRAYDLRGKVVLITGASRGLGLVLARALVAEGVTKIAICARDEEELENASDDLGARGARVLALQCDVMVKAQVETTVQRVLDEFGRIDVLINNAGIIQIAPAEVMTEEYAEAMNTHYWGPLHFIYAVLPHMKKRTKGALSTLPR